jgi:hypothetical protein
VWIAKLTPALARAPSPSPFEIRAGELMEANPFEVAAVAAVAAVPAIPRVPAVRARGARAAGGARAAIPAIPGIPGIPGTPAIPARKPAELVWWSMVRAEDVIDWHHVLPLHAVWLRGLAAPDRSSVAARDDPLSQVHSTAAILYRHLGAIAGDDTATHAQRARTMRREGERLKTLPAELRSCSFDAEVLETEAAHDLAFSRKQAQQDAITSLRVLYAKGAYPDLVDYLSRVSTPAERAVTIGALSAALPSTLSGATLFARLAPLDALLHGQSAFVIQCHNKRIPLDGPEGVTALLLANHQEWVAPLAGAAALGSSGADDEALTSTLLRTPCLLT